MGRRFRNRRQQRKEKKLRGREAKDALMRDFGDDKPKILTTDIIMISGCEDAQTSADVSNVSSFKLPDPAGRAGGACTSTLLNILYKDHENTNQDYTFIQVLEKMRQSLGAQKFSQIPQLTSSTELNLQRPFDLVPEGFDGTRRALMIGINYIGDDPGELRGCHNDVMNMKQYIQNVHGFPEENIVLLLDDGEHERPTKANMLDAYKKIVEESSQGDCIFLHYSGHGSKVADTSGDEADGYDEVLCPVDYSESGMITDDDLHDIIVKGLPDGVHVVSLMDCCHSGTILDLPYVFRPDGSNEGEMELDEDFDWKKEAGSIIEGLMAGKDPAELAQSALGNLASSFF